MAFSRGWSVLILAATTVIGACAESSNVGPAYASPATSSASPAPASSSGPKTAAQGSAGAVDCPLAAGGSQKVLYDRACSVDADCTFADTPVSCCGTRRMLGISVREAARVAAGLCPAQVWHGCACTAEPGRTDDQDILLGGDSPAPACVAGTCTTHVARAQLRH